MALSRCRLLGRNGTRSFTSVAKTEAQIQDVSSKISEALVRQFEEDGAIVLRQLVGLDWIEKLRVAGEENMKSPGPLCDEHVKPGEPGRFHDDQFLWMRHNTMRSFIFESPIGSIAKRMMRGQEARLFYDQLFVKEPGTKTTTPWHNDHSYWQLKGDQVISIWLALDHVPESACVQYVKGSHKWKLLHRIASFSGDSDRYKSEVMDSLPEMPDIENGQDKVLAEVVFVGVIRLAQFKLLRWEMEPGDCLVHHSFAVHGAPGIAANSGRRRAYATRWVGEEVTFDPRPGTMHYVWFKAGVNPGLQPGDPIRSDTFPMVC